MPKRKLRRLFTIIFIIALCTMIITSSFIDLAEGSKKRRRRLKKAAGAIADANSKIDQAGDVLIFTGGLLGQPEAVAAGGILKDIAYFSFIAARLLRLLAKFVFCDLPAEPIANISSASTPTIRYVMAEGLALSPENITHAPPGACISVYGEGFDTNETGNLVTFDTESTTVSLSNSTWLRVVVPYNVTGSVGITVTTSNGTSSPLFFTVDPLASPPDPIGSTTSEFLNKQKQALPLVKSEVEQVSLEEPQAFIDSGVNKTELISAIDAELGLISQFETEHYQNMSNLGWPLYKMDAIIVAWPPDEEAEMDALLNELRSEDIWPTTSVVGITGFKLLFKETMGNSLSSPATIDYYWNFSVDKWSGTQWAVSDIKGMSSSVVGYSIPANTTVDLPYGVCLLNPSNVVWGDWLRISYTFHWTYSGTNYSTNYRVRLHVHPGDIAGASSITVPYIGSDCVVNIKDVTPISLNWQKSVPPGTDPTSALARADINGDSMVNIKDVTPVSLNWQKTWTKTSPG